jgi:hypothetical protein
MPRRHALEWMFSIDRELLKVLLLLNQAGNIPSTAYRGYQEAGNSGSSF